MSRPGSYNWLSYYPGRSIVGRLRPRRAHTLAYTLGKGVFRRCVAFYPAVLLLASACATVPSPVASLPPAREGLGGAEITVMFGHEVDKGVDGVLMCRYYAQETSLLCLPLGEEIEQ